MEIHVRRPSNSPWGFGPWWLGLIPGATELNPSNARALANLGNVLDLTGQPEEGIANMERAVEINPLDPNNYLYFTFLSRAHMNARRYADCATWAKRALRLRPDYPNALFILAVGLGHLDRSEEAHVALADCERVHPSFIAKRSSWRPYRDPANNDHVWDGLRKAGLDIRDEPPPD